MINNLKLEIWGREFELPISYERFDDEELLKSQIDMVNTLSMDSSIIDESLSNVKKYTAKFTSSEIDNIFKYVIPNDIYVMRTEKPSFALFCDYKFDLEHGIAIVFENMLFSKIVPQDDVI